MKKQLTLSMALAAIVALMGSCQTFERTEPAVLVPLTVDEDSSLPSIGVNGTKLHSETFGDPADPMLVILHGGPGSDYRSILNFQEFAGDGYYVVFYDQRGSGLSRRHDAGVYTDNIFVDDLDAVIDYYHNDPDQKIILVGHSWGAMLASAYVNENPERIAGLVLMEPGGLTWEDTKDYVGRLRKLEPLGETTNDFVYQDQMITGDEHQILDYKFYLTSAGDFEEGNKAGNAGPFPVWRLGAVCNSASMEYAEKHPFDFTTNLNQFSTRVLFAYSEFNVAYGKEHALKVSAAFPDVQLVEIHGCGHEMPYFGWNNLYPVVKEYLDQILN